MRNAQRLPSIVYARACSEPEKVGSTNHRPAINGEAAEANSWVMRIVWSRFSHPHKDHNKTYFMYEDIPPLDGETLCTSLEADCRDCSKYHADYIYVDSVVHVKKHDTLSFKTFYGTDCLGLNSKVLFEAERNYSQMIANIKRHVT